MKKKIHFGKKACAIVTAGAFVISMGVPQLSGILSAANAESMSADGYVTAAASRAAQPAPEILGLSGVEETGASTGSAAYGVQSWDNPKYYIMGDTTYNTNANPYMVNAVSVVSGTDTNASPTIIQNTARNGGGRGPMGSLATYGEDNTDDAVWNMLPDVVVGVGGSSGNVDYTSDAYAGAINTAKGTTDYSPIGVEYYTATNTTIVKEMYALAEAGDKVVTDSNGKKKLRYGTALDIAKNFERYILGSQGLILEAINNETVAKKTVAAVSSYDETSKTFTLLKSGVAEGTASSNKLLEACEQVSDNLIDKLGKETATAEELAQADSIIIGGQSGGAGEALTDPNAIVAKMDASLVKKTYYVDSSKENPGSMYGVVMNSVENTQNIGRVLGFVYPEVIDQDDWMCYYYDKFYHIKSDKLAEVIDKAMDGVRNYDAADAANYMNWTEADASTYDAAKVQSQIQQGVGYLKTLGTKVSTVLQPSTYLANDATSVVAINKATVTLSQTSYTADGTAKTPEVTTVTLPSGITLDKSDYDVSYENNTEAGEATVKVAGKGSYAGTAYGTFNINSWTRLAGNTALGTMKNIVNEGWESSDYAIVATNKGYQDALSATGLAGVLKCPVLMTTPNSLSSVTSALLTSLKVKNVLIVGGESAVSENVYNQIKALSGIETVDRLAGGTAVGTARQVYDYGKTHGGWGSDAIVATINGYQDALSIAPYAYTKKAPIFLTDSGKGTLGTKSAGDIKAGGFTRTLIVGGTSAVKESVEGQVTGAKRLAGNTAYGTCKQVAEFCLTDSGMSASHVGVATGKTYQDALCGAALCGLNNSILVLADDKNSSNINKVIATNKASLSKCYVFGGKAAVSETVYSALEAAIK